MSTNMSFETFKRVRTLITSFSNVELLKSCNGEFSSFKSSWELNYPIIFQTSSKTLEK